MKQNKFKILVIIISSFVLITNTTPIFANIIEIEILGGGYKLKGPSEINFTPIISSTSDRSNFISFRDVSENSPSQTNNFLKIIDENGGNPFDVTVSAGEIKRHEPLLKTVISGSTTNQIKVSDTTGFYEGDTIQLLDPSQNTTIINQNGGSIFTINSIVDNNTLNLSDTLNIAPESGFSVNRIVDCDLSPRKCIGLNNFAITNYDGQAETIYQINGNESDLSTNSETDSYRNFGGNWTTGYGSTNRTLILNTTGDIINGEEIRFPSNSGVMPLTNVVTSIDSEDTVTLRDPFTIAPGAGINVKSNTSRTFTLANGTGAQPGEWNIFPSLQITIPAGQMPGSYETVLNLAIL